MRRTRVGKGATRDAAAVQSDGITGGLPGPTALTALSLHNTTLLRAPVHTQREKVWSGDTSLTGLLRRHLTNTIGVTFLGTSQGRSQSPSLTTTLSRPRDGFTLAECTNSRSVKSAETPRHPTPAPRTHAPTCSPAILPATTAGIGASDSRAQLTEHLAPRPARYLNTHIFPKSICSLSLFMIS